MFNKISASLFIFFIVIFQPISSQEVIINEIMSVNITGIEDDYGDNSDWIEIYNSSSSAINLKDYYLSDRKDNPLKWKFPNISIAPLNYILIFASENESTTTQLHASFKLSQDGEFVLLSKSNGDLIDQIDSIPMNADISYGRKPDGGALKFFNEPTPGSSNISEGYDGFVSEPNVSSTGGFYPIPIDVDVVHDDTEVLIRYTLDGSEPNSNSPIYNTNFHFVNIESEPNGISLIPTNPSLDYPKPGYDQNRADSRGWLEPYTIINKAHVLKVKAFKENYLPSHTITETYFINPETIDRYSLPVVSITTDIEGFFSDETGIYVYGTTGEVGNYKEEGREWERPVRFQLFDEDGNLAIDQTLGARIHGGGGRHSTIKNLRMYARDDYGKDKFKYKWFDNDNTKEFKCFLVRGPGHRPDCTPRDDFADLLIQNFEMDLQHLQHIIVFLNGEYWGIQTVKERFDQDYLEEKYGKKDEDYVILKNTGTLHSGESEDVEVYYNLLDFVNNNDMSLDENYEYVKTQVDMENYLSYFTTEIFLGNADWINVNIKFWRYKGLDNEQGIKSALDGRWRWFMFDFDGAFGGSCDAISYSNNMLDNAFDPDYGRATELARGLKQNEQWRFDFVNRMCDLLNSSFNHKRFGKKIDEIDAIMTPEMMEFTERWRYPSTSETLDTRQFEIPSMTKWNETIEGFGVFNDNRKRKIIGHMQEEFSINDTISIVLDVNNISMGNIKINSILVSEALDGVNTQVYPWSGMYFQDVHFPLIAIPKLGYRFVEWQESGDTQDTLTVDLGTGATFTAIFEKDPDFVFDDALYINEFMASNKTTIEDEDGSYADWIEIYNPNNKAVDIASYYVSDDAEDTYKYQFPRGAKSTIIPAYGYKLIWADNRSERGEVHTNFKLSSSGEDIVFIAPDSSLIDFLSYGTQQVDVSFGRENDGDDAWKFFQVPIGPTPNATNNNAAIGDINYQKTLSIYPNPVPQGRMVYFSDVMNIEVYNSVGQLMQRVNSVSKLETDDFSSGIYFIKTERKGIIKLVVE